MSGLVSHNEGRREAVFMVESAAPDWVAHPCDRSVTWRTTWKKDEKWVTWVCFLVRSCPGNDLIFFIYLFIFTSLKTIHHTEGYMLVPTQYLYWESLQCFGVIHLLLLISAICLCRSSSYTQLKDENFKLEGFLSNLHHKFSQIFFRIQAKLVL